MNLLEIPPASSIRPSSFGIPQHILEPILIANNNNILTSSPASYAIIIFLVVNLIHEYSAFRA